MGGSSAIFRMYPEIAPVYVRYDSKSNRYIFRCGPWTTASDNDFIGGYFEYRFVSKDGEYADPYYNSYLLAFAMDSDWKVVAAIPSHHEVIDGPQCTGFSRFMRDFNAWFERKQKECDPGDSPGYDDLIGQETLRKLGG